MKSLSQRGTCTPKFITAFFIIDNTWKQPNYPLIRKWIKEMWYIIIEYYSVIKQKEILLYVKTQMKLKDIMLNEVSQTEKDKCIISFIHGI